MDVTARVLLLVVAAIHVYIVVLEMALWTTPRARTAFGVTAELAEQTRAMAANQGLYNAFLVAGLLVGAFASGRTGFWFGVFFSSCVAIAGLYGAATVNRRILLVQTLPATLALAAVIAAG